MNNFQGDLNAPVQSQTVSSTSEPNNNLIIYYPRRYPNRSSFSYNYHSFRIYQNLNQIVPNQPGPNIIPNVEAKKTPIKVSKLEYMAIIFIFFISFLCLVLVYRTFPAMDADEKQYIKLPMNLNDAQNLGNVLQRYKDKYFYQVFFGVSISYIFLQTFAIPGSLFLSILSGFLFPFYLALMLVCVCSALGASLCYILSMCVGGKIVYYYFPDRIDQWSAIVEKNKGNILYYMLFLRITPFLPNWFINLVAPLLNVPLVPFTLGTFFGVAPPSFMAIQAGQTLLEMTSASQVTSWTSLTLLIVFSLVALLPILLKQKLKSKLE